MVMLDRQTVEGGRGVPADTPVRISTDREPGVFTPAPSRCLISVASRNDSSRRGRNIWTLGRRSHGRGAASGTLNMFWSGRSGLEPDSRARSRRSCVCRSGTPALSPGLWRCCRPDLGTAGRTEETDLRRFRAQGLRPSCQWCLAGTPLRRHRHSTVEHQCGARLPSLTSRSMRSRLTSALCHFPAHGGWDQMRQQLPQAPLCRMASCAKAPRVSGPSGLSVHPLMGLPVQTRPFAHAGPAHRAAAQRRAQPRAQPRTSTSSWRRTEPVR
jgi:hypothetical protein